MDVNKENSLRQVCFLLKYLLNEAGGGIIKNGLLCSWQR